MTIQIQSYRPEQIISEIGYADPMDAAKEQARMVLLGRLARYEAEIARLANSWGMSFEEMAAGYQAANVEDFAADDAYLEWQWLRDAEATIRGQLAALDAD
ncbi:MAG: hypothetical protein J5I90_07115 [Caldilineales bacterium]|nr:hypothetical protein [Caldilineales bacterium]